MFDEGFSARYAEHISRGALGKFLAAIEAGLIPKGSVIWVESIDRLTRQNPMNGLKMVLFGIIEKGVGIYVDDLHTLYDSKNVDDQIGELYGEIRRAYRESQRKSELALAAWEQKRADVRKKGGLLDPKIPHWLVVKDGKFAVRPGAKKTLTKLFTLKEKDRSKGAVTIARHLNMLCRKSKDWWLPPGGWTDRYVFRCLRNRALIGEKQPGKLIGGKFGERVPEGDPFLDYFPVVIDKGLFLNVQQILADRAGKQGGGRNDQCRNVMQGLLKCGYCGGPVYLKSREDDLSFYCRHGRQKINDCDCPEFRHYQAAQDELIECCRRLKVDQVLPQKDEQSKICRGLRQQMQRLSAELEDDKNRIANLDDLLEQTKNPKRQKRYEGRIIELESQQAIKEKELTRIGSELKKAEKKRKDFVDWQANIESLKTALDDPAVRRRLNFHLKEIIERIEVFSKGPLPPTSASSITEAHSFADYFYATEDAAFPEGREATKSQRERERRFIAWVDARRNSRHGRFLKVHFKGPMQYTEVVVPRGSAAGQPDIDALFQQFKNSYRPSTRKSG